LFRRPVELPILDPEISLEAAEFPVPRAAKTRAVPEPELRSLIQAHAITRQFGFLGEPRVNVLKLDLALDEKYGRH
jgi:K+-transporting ATPase ATPase C chain